MLFKNFLKKIQSFNFIFWALTLTLPTIYCVFIVKQTQEEFLKKSVYISSKIKKEIEDLFEEDQKILSWLGSVILSQNIQENPEAISKLLISTGDLRLNTLATSYVSWADAKGDIVVSGKEGVIKHNPKNIQNRSYFHDCREHVWLLRTSTVNQSYFSSRPVLPTAMGIRSPDKFEGYLVLGLRIDELNNAFKRKFEESGFVFLMLENENELVLSSNPLIQESYKRFKDRSFADGPDICVACTLKIDGYPYEILAGYHKKAFYSGLFTKIAPVLLFIILFLFVCFILLRFIKNSFLSPLQKIYENSSCQTGESLLEPSKLAATALQKISSILESIETKNASLGTRETATSKSFDTLERYTKEIQHSIEYFLLGLTQKIALERISYKTEPEGFLDQLYEQITTFITFGDDNGPKTTFEIGHLLKECELIWHKALVEQDILFESKGLSELPVYYGRRVQIKKALLSLIGLCIERSLRGGRITVQTSLKPGKKAPKTICICIEDDGVSENFVKTLEEKFGATLKQESLFYCQNLNEIREILEKNGGRLQSIFSEPTGRKHTIFLPIKKTETPSNLIRKGNFVLIQGGCSD